MKYFVLLIKSKLMLIFFLSSFIQYGFSQSFNDMQFGTPFSESFMTIVKTDSFYYLSGLQSDSFTIFYKDSTKYRSLILKLDHSGNILDTFYLDTIGYNRTIRNIIPLDSSFIVFFVTNPTDNLGKVSIALYDLNFSELNCQILDTIPNYFSRTDLISEYHMINNTLYLCGFYLDSNNIFIEKSFMTSMNISTMQYKWFHLFPQTIYPTGFVMDTMKNQFSIFDIDGNIYTYDTTSALLHKDSLMHRFGGPMDYPFQYYISLLPYQDSLFLINAMSLKYHNQYVGSGMVLTVTDSNFNQKETYYYEMDSLQFCKTAINRSLVESSDNCYFIGGGVNPKYSFFDNGVYVAKVDSAFNLLWEKKLMNDSFPIVTDIEPTDDGGVLVLYSYIYVESGNPNRDAKLIKVGSNGEITNIAEFKNPYSKPFVELYPNPANSEINIKFIDPQQTLKSFRIIDTQGKELIRKRTNNNNSKIEINSLPIGAYIINGKTNTGERFSSKFVKE